MDQRLAFLTDWLRDAGPMTALAWRDGISRKTAYKWVARYHADPAHGLADRSRAPTTPGRRGAADVAAAIVALRRAHPWWGPKKLRAILCARTPERVWPAASTMGAVLRRAGLCHARRRIRSAPPLTQPLVAAQAPNDLWTADFKGWFRTADGTRCDPLTVTDACSRVVVCCQITPPSAAGVRPWFARAFRTYGLPRALRTDNGPPFATAGAGGLSQLAIWWLKLGIHVERIAPGHPEQNGRHERFHRTLQQEAVTPPAATPRAQQARVDRLRAVFNTVRPHEALGQRPPARVYVPSSRQYPVRLAEPWDDATHQVRRVRPTGQIKWHGDLVFVSEAVRGERIGLAETDRGDWLVRFMHVELGRIDRRTRHFTPAWSAGRARRTPTRP